jgi:hypothetical protein
MNEKQIFDKWGVIIPEADQLLEYLFSALPDKCFYIDSLPLTVTREHGEKYDQVEDELFDGMQDKALNILKKLWLYSDVYFESELLFQKQTIQKIKAALPEVYEKLHLIFPVQSESELIQILDIEQLRTLLKLSYKDLIDLSFYFDQYQMLVIPSWSCFITFLNDQSKFDFIKHVINVEGLYVRKLPVDKTGG